MKRRILLAAFFCGTAALTMGQPVRVFSELAQIDAAGNVIAPEFPREILSPALVRNGYTSFQVVIQVPPQKRFEMQMGLNPENAVSVSLYRRDGGMLEPLELPYEGSGPQVLWLDVWAERDAPVRRIKVEPQVNIDNNWVIYPMEMRVRDAQVPGVLPPATLRTLLCGGVSTAAPEDAKPSVEQFHLRNERQDAALSGQASPMDRDELKKRLGGCTARPSSDPEAYLKARDFFFTPLWMRIRNER